MEDGPGHVYVYVGMQSLEFTWRPCRARLQPCALPTSVLRRSRRAGKREGTREKPGKIADPASSQPPTASRQTERAGTGSRVNGEGGTLALAMERRGRARSDTADKAGARLPNQALCRVCSAAPPLPRAWQTTLDAVLRVRP